MLLVLESNSKLKDTGVKQLGLPSYSKRLSFVKNIRVGKILALSAASRKLNNERVFGTEHSDSFDLSRGGEGYGGFKTIFNRRMLKLKRLMSGAFAGNVVVPTVAARIKRLIRAIRASRIARRQWWRFARQLQRSLPVKKYIRILRTHSRWRYPFYRQKIRTVQYRKRLEKIFSSKRRIARRYMFVPRPFIKRMRHIYFMTSGFWKRSDDLIRLRISFTLNNMFVALADRLNKNLLNVSSGVLGFKGTTKLTTYAIERMAVHVAKFMRRKRYKNLYIIFNSGAVGYKAKLFVETLIRNALTVKYLTVSDAVPHNGVRPRKTKRR